MVAIVLLLIICHGSIASQSLQESCSRDAVSDELSQECVSFLQDPGLEILVQEANHSEEKEAELRAGEKTPPATPNTENTPPATPNINAEVGDSPSLVADARGRTEADERTAEMNVAVGDAPPETSLLSPSLIAALSLEEPVDGLLSYLRLPSCSHKFAAEGYEFISDLLDADSDDVDGLVNRCAMKKPEGKRFRKALAQLKGSSAEIEISPVQLVLKEQAEAGGVAGLIKVTEDVAESALVAKAGVHESACQRIMLIVLALWVLRLLLGCMRGLWASKFGFIFYAVVHVALVQHSNQASLFSDFFASFGQVLPGKLCWWCWAAALWLLAGSMFLLVDMVMVFRVAVKSKSMS